jgi:hypothetical protein
MFVQKSNYLPTTRKSNNYFQGKKMAKKEGFLPLIGKKVILILNILASLFRVEGIHRQKVIPAAVSRERKDITLPER